jgi:hypothetical protein
MSQSGKVPPQYISTALRQAHPTPPGCLGNAPTNRARLGTVPLGNHSHHAACRNRLVRQHVADHRSAGVVDGFRHPGLRQLLRARVSDVDFLVTPRETVRHRAKKMPTRIGDLRHQRSSADAIGLRHEISQQGIPRNGARLVGGARPTILAKIDCRSLSSDGEMLAKRRLCRGSSFEKGDELTSPHPQSPVMHFRQVSATGRRSKPGPASQPRFQAARRRQPASSKANGGNAQGANSSLRAIPPIRLLRSTTANRHAPARASSLLHTRIHVVDRRRLTARTHRALLRCASP